MTARLIERGRVTTWEVQPADPRAKAIVKQLMRKRRKDGRYYYPASGDGGTATVEERQQFAVQMFFTAAVSLSTYPTRPALLRRDLKLARASLLAMAENLRATTEMCEQLGIRASHIPHTDPPIDPFVLAAEEAKKMADDLEGAFLIVERDRGEMCERAFAVAMARLANRIFGQPLCGIVATITRIMFDCKVDQYRVRDWWADFTGKE